MYHTTLQTIAKQLFCMLSGYYSCTMFEHQGVKAFVIDSIPIVSYKN